MVISESKCILFHFFFKHEFTKKKNGLTLKKLKIKQNAKKKRKN